MNVSLSPETIRLIEDALKYGDYKSVDELIQASLFALYNFGPLDEETLAAIDRAELQIERGEVYDWRDTREELRKRLGIGPEEKDD